MEDTLFSLILFVGFYCLYSKMFAPKLNCITTAAQVSTVPATESVKVESVKAVEPLTTDRTTATGATSHHSAKSEQQTTEQQTTTELAPDRDFMTSADCNQLTLGNGRQTPQTRDSRSRQPGKSRAIAQSK